MKKKIYNVINFVLLSMMLVSCDCCDDTEESIVTKEPEKMSSESAGDFIVINTRTNDTLTVKGYSTNPLAARIGDTLKIVFNPEEKFKGYPFKTSYNLPNSKVEKDDLEYEYIVTNLKEGTYDIDLEANSSGTSIANDTIWELTAKGKFYLKIIIPYVNIDYQLSCPTVLLEYAIPQITYVGNDGTPVTFTIPESDWEEGVVYVPNTTVIVIDGDTIVSESMKKMQWTKHVKYDDFSIVDDEMTVVYVPRDNIPMGNVDKIEGLKPGLSAHLEFVDDNGRYYKPMIIDIDIDISIGTPGSRSLSDIISSYRNYKGFHVESNGTYDTK